MQYSIIQMDDIQQARLRVDAEYWHPDLIANDRLISSSETIGGFVVSSIPNIKSTPVNRDFEYLEISQIAPDSCAYRTIPVEQGREPDRAHYILRKNDVVVSTVRPNRNAVAFIREDGIIGSSGLCVLRTTALDPKYLFAFCKTDYFIKCLVRANRATMYPAVSNQDIFDTPILLGSEQFRASICPLIADALECQDTANQSYAAAEQILLANLQLDEWQPRHRIWSVRSSVELRKAGRIDAEYYQPKYDEILDAIRDCSGSWDTLGNLTTMQRCVEVGSQEYLDEGIPFVRVSNLTPFDLTEEKYISEELYKTLRHHQPWQGEILLSKDATPGIAYHLRDTPGKMIPSGGILRLRRKDDRVNDEYLTLVLNSMLVKEQANRDVGGSVILHWRPDQVAETLVPILPQALQAEIQQKVAESADLRQQSRQLLESAKRAVEIAIEQDEATAIAWLEAQHEETPC